MFAALLLASSLNSPGCWDIFGAALQHSAAAAHPPYVSYEERIVVTDDSLPLISSQAHVDYRDDGVARLLDQRFDYQPIVSRRVEPGPPELGPYGKNRQAWLPLQGDAAGLPLISSIHIAGTITCTVADVENYKGHRSYHLIFDRFAPNRPNLKAIWIDTASYDVWKLIVSGYVNFEGGTESPQLADFAVEMGYQGPYLVVNHVVWQYRLREFSQYTTYFGEYYLTGYEFPESLPSSYFASDSSGSRI